MKTYIYLFLCEYRHNAAKSVSEWYEYRGSHISHPGIIPLHPHIRSNPHDGLVMASGSKAGGSQQLNRHTDAAVEIQMKLEHLNQTTLGDMEKIVKGNPPGSDLWPFFRKANANYKVTRDKLVEKPKPVNDIKGEWISTRQRNFSKLIR